MLRNLTENSQQNLLQLHTLSYSMVKMLSTHRDAFSEIFELEAQGQLLQQQKDKRRKKMKKRNKKNETPKNMGHFLVQRCQILISAHVQKKML